MRIFTRQDIKEQGRSNVKLTQHQPNRPRVFQQTKRCTRYHPHGPPHEPRAPTSSTPITTRCQHVRRTRHNDPILVSQDRLFHDCRSIQPRNFRRFARHIHARQQTRRRSTRQQRSHVTRFKRSTKVSNNFYAQETPNRNRKQDSIQHRRQPTTSIHHQSIHLQHGNTKRRVRHENRQERKSFRHQPTPQRNSNLRPSKPRQPSCSKTRPSNPSKGQGITTSHTKRHQRATLSKQRPLRGKGSIQKNRNRIQALLQRRHKGSTQQPTPSQIPTVRTPRRQESEPHPHNTTTHNQFRMQAECCSRCTLCRVAGRMQARRPSTCRGMARGPFLPCRILVGGRGL